MVGAERRVDRRGPTLAHEGPKAPHPLRRTVTADLRGINRTPVLVPGFKPVYGRAEHPRDTLNHVLVTHLHGDDRIHAGGCECSLTLEQPNQPGQFTVFAAASDRGRSEVPHWGVKRRETRNDAPATRLPPPIVVTTAQAAARARPGTSFDEAMWRCATPSRASSLPRRDRSLDLSPSRLAQERTDRIHESDGWRPFDRRRKGLFVMRFPRTQSHDRPLQQRSDPFDNIAVRHRDPNDGNTVSRWRRAQEGTLAFENANEPVKLAFVYIRVCVVNG